MALITAYSSDNRVIDTKLDVTYTKSRISGSWTGDIITGGAPQSYEYMMEYHRYASKSYRYIGMTEAAADECMADMKELYTRTPKCSIWTPTVQDSFGLGSWSEESAGEIIMAEIVPQRNEDGSYDIVINVREDDVRLRKIGHAVSYAILFGTEMNRDYDGESE